MRNEQRYGEKNFIFYYLRDDNNHPRTTVCLFRAPNNKIYRGLSICSHQDGIDKNQGRNKAMGRAVRAYIHKENSEPISGIYFSTMIPEFYFGLIDSGLYKSIEVKQFTDYEKYLMEKKWPVEQNL